MPGYGVGVGLGVGDGVGEGIGQGDGDGVGLGVGLGVAVALVLRSSNVVRKRVLYWSHLMPFFSMFLLIADLTNVALEVSVNKSVCAVESVAVWLVLLCATEIVCVGATFGCGSVLPYTAKLPMHKISTRKREPQPRPNLANRVWARNHCRNARRL